MNRLISQRTESVIRSGLRCVAVLIVWGYMTGLVWAQEANDTAKPSGPTVAPVISPQPNSPAVNQVPADVPQDILYLPDEDGKLKPVPMNVTLEQYLEWLDQRQDQAGNQQSEWTIRSFNAQGSLKQAANDVPWASINCQLIIETGQSPRWQSIPLMMGEGLLAGLSDSAAETASSQVMITRDIDSGQWLLWYRDRKSFTVNLDLLVPVQQQGEQNQLQLTMPVSSRTEFNLLLDRPDLQVQLLSRGFWEKQAQENAVNIRIAGFQQAIDLRWAPDRPDTEMSPIYHVDTQIDFQRGSDANLISARQKVTIDRGLLNSIQVKIPTGFQIDAVTADLPMRYEIEATDPSWLTLIFPQPIQMSVTLDWKLSSPIRRFESQVIINGFEVEGARTQTGKVGIIKSNEWRIGPLPTQVQNIFSMNVRDYPVMGDYLLAYRFYSQPYRLPLNTQRAETQYTHSAFYDLHASTDRLKLRAQIQLTPRIGALDQVRIEWVDLDSGIWTPERIVIQDTGEPIRWEITGANQIVLPLPNLERSIVIEIEASRRLINPYNLVSEQKPVIVSLPQIASSESTLLERVVRTGNSIDLAWQPIIKNSLAEEYASRNLPDAWRQKSIYQQQSTQPERHRWYRISSVTEELEMVLAPVQRKLQAESVVSMTVLRTDPWRAQLEQRIPVHIEDLPLDQLELTREGEFSAVNPPQVKLFDASGNTLPIKVVSETGSVSQPPQVESSTSEESTQSWTITAGEPLIGEYELAIQHTVPLESIETLSALPISLSLFAVGSVEKLPTRFLNQTPYLLQLPSIWDFEETVTEHSSWQTDNLPEKLELLANVLQPRLIDASGPMRANIHTWISSAGEQLSEVRIQMARTPTSFVAANTAEQDFVSAYWKGAGATQATLLKSVDTKDQKVLLFPADTVAQPGELVFNLKKSTPARLRSLNQTELFLPEHSLSDYLPVVQWTVTLPQGMYLWSRPNNFEPDYHWGISWWGLRRLPNPTLPGLPTANLPYSQPTYQLQAIGWPQQMRFRTIGRALLMTLGTGLPLFVLMFLAGLSPERRLKSGLLLTSLALLLLIYLTEPVLLMLQPAVLGTLFLIIATGIARQLRRHRDEPTLIIIGPRDSHDNEGSGQMDISDHDDAADEVTRVQAAPHSLMEPSSVS